MKTTDKKKKSACENEQKPDVTQREAKANIRNQIHSPDLLLQVVKRPVQCQIREREKMLK